MSKASNYIYSFLDDNMGVYNNQQGIEFCVNNDDSVIVNHWIKDPPQDHSIEFGLCYTSENFNDFIRDFGFARTQQLKSLSPEHLWELYYKGQAEIYCIVAEKPFFFALYFKLEGNKMVIRDDQDEPCKLDEILQTPEQFIEYTRRQFQFYKR